jgi:hypothetical protein
MVMQSEDSSGLSFRSAALSREESAGSLPAANRFLADKAGFGMTKGVVFVSALLRDTILCESAIT